MVGFWSLGRLDFKELLFYLKVLNLCTVIYSIFLMYEEIGCYKPDFVLHCLFLLDSGSPIGRCYSWGIVGDELGHFGLS